MHPTVIGNENQSGRSSIKSQSIDDTQLIPELAKVRLCFRFVGAIDISYTRV
jgi:hypothetical protein